MFGLIRTHVIRDRADSPLGRGKLLRKTRRSEAAWIVATPLFMRLPAGPPRSHAFVIAVLPGLGGMDPFMRIDYPVPLTRYP